MPKEAQISSRCLALKAGPLSFSRQSPFEQGYPEGIKKAVQSFGEIKLGVGDEAAHIIEETKQIGFPRLVPGSNLRTVHGIRLPDVIGKLCLEAPAVDGLRAVVVHQPVLVEDAVECRGTQSSGSVDDAAAFDFRNKGRRRDLGKLVSEADDALDGLRVQSAAYAPITSALGIERFQLATACLVASDPTQNRRAGNTAAR